jgi:hypothetical protein
LVIQNGCERQLIIDVVRHLTVHWLDRCPRPK